MTRTPQRACTPIKPLHKRQLPKKHNNLWTAWAHLGREAIHHKCHLPRPPPAPRQYCRQDP